MEKCWALYDMNYIGIHRDWNSLSRFTFAFHSDSLLSLSELKVLYVKFSHYKALDLM